MLPKKTNAVNSIVSDLIRAAAGSSAKNVSDQDVDKYVADLILKEAEEKRKKYNDIGVKAYQPITPPSQKPKPNTRFLLNMVKATDSHNQSVIKANEDNVARLRKERLERERLDRDSMRKRRHNRHEDKSHRRHSRKRSRSSSRSRSPPYEKRSRYHSSRHKHRSPSPSIRQKENTSKTKTRDIQFKGRGKVRIDVSSMDKYFSKGYDPLLDIESDQEEYVFAAIEEKTKDKKKKKKSRSSKKKKKKHSSGESDSDSSSSSINIGPKPAVVRAWDVGKDAAS